MLCLVRPQHCRAIVFGQRPANLIKIRRPAGADLAHCLMIGARLTGPLAGQHLASWSTHRLMWPAAGNIILNILLCHKDTHTARAAHHGALILQKMASTLTMIPVLSNPVRPLQDRTMGFQTISRGTFPVLAHAQGRCYIQCICRAKAGRLRLPQRWLGGTVGALAKLCPEARLRRKARWLHPAVLCLPPS